MPVTGAAATENPMGSEDRKTVHPEDLVWQYLRMRLAKPSGPPEKPPEKWLLEQLPLRIELSEEFLPAWQRNVKTAVIRLLIELFGHDPLLVLPDGETPVAVTTADRAFWQEARFEFSARAVDRVWEDLISGTGTGRVTPAWDDVTPWDAVFLACLDPQRWGRWSFDWLRKRNADGLVVILFLERAPIGIPDRLPWLRFFQPPHDQPFSLRHRLILRTGRFFAEMVRVAETCRDGQVLANLANPARFGRREILEALTAWTGDGASGLHDRRFLDGAAEQAGLYRNMDTFFTLTRDFAALSAAAAAEPPRPA